MNEKELLEKAAKAAGIDVEPDGNFAFPHRLWNPLENDGDALRLAVKLGISIDIMWDGENDQYDPVIANYNGGRARFEEQMGLGFDDMAATRLAITRAAAAMVKE